MGSGRVLFSWLLSFLIISRYHFEELRKKVDIFHEDLVSLIICYLSALWKAVVLLLLWVSNKINLWISEGGHFP